jgi:ABC-2 type transport system ATP-binding protein
MRYGHVVAVEDASFDVQPREVVGLLGPNGAGKSTIMKILTTYLWPTSGTAKICGKDILTEPLEVRKRVGYLPEVLPLYMDMEVGSYLNFVGRARGLRGGDLRTRIGWVKERCDLAPVFRTMIRHLSKGYRQRTALGQALIHDPEVVILDEPTSGLDPHQIIEIRKLIRELAKEKTVILSTHILHEVEAVSDRIVIISAGHIVADGTLEHLRRRAMKRERAELAVVASQEEVKGALGGLVEAKRIDFISAEDGTSKFRVEADFDKELLPKINEVIKRKGWVVKELHDVPFSLEETFLALTRKETRPRQGGAQ